MRLQSKWSRDLLSSRPRVISSGSRSELCSIAWLSSGCIRNRRPLDALSGIIRQSQCLRLVCLIISRARCLWPVLLRCVRWTSLEKLWDRLMMLERPLTGGTNGTHICRSLSSEGFLPLNITRGRIYPQTSRNAVLDIVESQNQRSKICKRYPDHMPGNPQL